jgi:hypothetical protein
MAGISGFAPHASRCGRLLLLILLMLGLGLIPASAAAQAPHHAALIVDFGDGRVIVRVVAFTGETISGLEILQRSGIDIAVMVNPGGGAALCAVEGVGCAPTPQECFCQCRGTPCHYWSYFHLQDGGWVYAGMGTADHVLYDGDVDGWVWGDGRTPPPLLTWEEIWAQGGTAQPTVPPPLPTATSQPPTAAMPPTVAPTTSAITPTLVPSSSPLVSSTVLPTPTRPSMSPTAGPALLATATPTVAATSSPLEQETTLSTPAPTPPVETAGEGVPWGSLATFGGLALLLVILGLLVRRRR